MLPLWREPGGLDAFLHLSFVIRQHDKARFTQHVPSGELQFP